MISQPCQVWGRRPYPMRLGPNQGAVARLASGHGRSSVSVTGPVAGPSGRDGKADLMIATAAHGSGVLMRT